MKKKNLIGGVLVLSLSLISLSAFAANDNYPASMCVKWGPGYVTPTLASSRIYNSSTSKMYVDCPAIRKDFDRYGNPSEVNSSWISAIDTNTRDAVCATLVKFRQTGYVTQGRSASGGRQCTTRTLLRYAQKLRLGSLRLGHPDFHLFIGVSVPGKTANGARSGIVTYNVAQ